MPPALDRLLASPSALRVLRTIINAPEPPSAYFEAKCHRCTAPRRAYSSVRNTSPPQIRWVRSTEQSENQKSRSEIGTTKVRNSQAHGLDAKSRNFLDGADEWISARGAGGDEQHEAAIWAQKLYVRERVYGLNGIRDIWSASCGFDLPTADTPDAEFLWGTFIKAPDLIFPVIDHAADILKRTGQVYPHLYELCMSYWLPQDEHWGKVRDYHHELVVKLRLQKLPLRHLAQAGAHRYAPSTFDTFMDIYKTSNERNVYDAIIPILCARASTATARRWHALCVQRGDLPSPHVASQPLVQSLMAHTSTSLDLESEVVKTISGGMRYGKPKMNEYLLRRLQGRDTAPVRFEDAFCARMFATRAFPPNSIIKGLAMVGVNEIGPQAVRAMASRTDPITDLPLRFEELKAAGIALQGSVFSLALETFATQQQWALVRSILDSDQHPDVYDDAKTQRELLDYYLQQQDFEQVHRTLAILSLFHSDSSTESWNLLLQAHIRRSEPDSVLQVLQTMRSKGVIVTSNSVLLLKGFLRPRKRTRNPSRSPHAKFDDLRFVTRVFITILEGGIGRIPPDQWREILRRYGMLGRLRELRRLSLWLLCWYAPRQGTEFDNLPKSDFLDAATKTMRAAYPNTNYYFNFPSHTSQTSKAHPVRQLFPPPFQQALIVWGFRAGLLPNAPLEQSLLSHTAAKKHFRRRFLRKGLLKRQDWRIGLRTLVELRELGVHVHRHTVTKALQAMFVNLFGRGRSKVRENRIMEAVNTVPYAEYVREVNRIWGSALLSETHVLEKSGYGSRWHPRLSRKLNRGSCVSLDELIGPEWRKDSGGKDGMTSEEGGMGELKRSFIAQSEAMNLDTDGASTQGLNKHKRVPAVGSKQV